jgi:hypothetical protein
MTKSVKTYIGIELDREIRRISRLTGLSKKEASNLILKGYLNNKKYKKHIQSDNYGFN